MVWSALNFFFRGHILLLKKRNARACVYDNGFVAVKFLKNARDLPVIVKSSYYVHTYMWLITDLYLLHVVSGSTSGCSCLVGVYLLHCNWPSALCVGDFVALGGKRLSLVRLLLCVCVCVCVSDCVVHGLIVSFLPWTLLWRGENPDYQHWPQLWWLPQKWKCSVCMSGTRLNLAWALSFNLASICTLWVAQERKSLTGG